MHKVVDVFWVDSGYENGVAFLDLDIDIVIITVMNIHEVREIFWKVVRLPW